jgi:hypothetical protein
MGLNAQPCGSAVAAQRVATSPGYSPRPPDLKALLITRVHHVGIRR